MMVPQCAAVGGQGVNCVHGAVQCLSPSVLLGKNWNVNRTTQKRVCSGDDDR